MPGLNPEQYALLAELQAASDAYLDSLADAWAAGEISLAEYQQLFKQELKDLYLATAWAVTGDVRAKSPAIYGQIAGTLEGQYTYAAEFFIAIGLGALTLNQIKARARLYVAAGRQVAEGSAMTDGGLPELPHYPADGSTPCGSNDKCTLRIDSVENGFDIYWTLHPAEHCGVCIARANGSPLRVRYGAILNPEAWP